MLQTSNNQDFNFSITDSTVYVNPGVARTGNTVLTFRGDTITFNQMTSYDFKISPDAFQYSALVIRDIKNTTFAYSQADMTSVMSPYADNTNSLVYPVISSDMSAHPVGLFLFGNPDSTVTLLSSKKVF